jgi:hypothetical protein
MNKFFHCNFNKMKKVENVWDETLWKHTSISAYKCKDNRLSVRILYVVFINNVSHTQTRTLYTITFI